MERIDGPHVQNIDSFFFSIFMVSEDEWGHIRKFFQVDHTISVVRNKDGPELLSSDPKVCAECLAKRKEQEELVSYFLYY